MIGQKTINSFFFPVAKKRALEEQNDKEDKAALVKRLKSGKGSSLKSQSVPADEGEYVSWTSAATPEGLGQSWRKELHAEFDKPYFVNLTSFLSEECKKHIIYPPHHQVFAWTHMCTIHEVKVVILGQDPYHGPGQAHGLCFSVQRPVPPPPSLVNMYKELATDIEGFQHPGHGDLTGWAKQGVLLLNAVLTVQAHQANSHKGKGWETFTDSVIQWLSTHLDGLVFMLWGAYAQKKGASIDRKRHHILQAVHPSPLSAHRGFFGCQHFSKTNELLEKMGKTPIDWKAL